HTRKLVNDWNTQFLQHFGRTQTRQLEQFRCVDRPAGDDDFFVGEHSLALGWLGGIRILNADRTFTVEQNACRLRVGLNVQIAPMPYGMQKGSRRAHAESLVYRPLKITYAFLRGAVIVFGTRHAIFDSTVDERFANGVYPVDIADGQLAAATAVGVI